MRYSIKLLPGITAIVSIACAGFVFARFAIKDRAIVSEDLANGTRVRVVQRLTGEPFNTSIYYDDGDGQWRWYYFDHEDWYRGVAEVTIIDDVVHAKSCKCNIKLDTRTGECEIFGTQVGPRTYKKSDRILELPSGL